MNLDWPLVSRDDEVRTITRVLARGAVSAGSTRAVLIVGASGAGRTRLLRTVTQLQRAAGQPVASVTGTTASAAMPFRAVAHLMPRGVGVGQPGVYELAASAMSGAHPPGGPVIAVDDAHLLDEASAGMLQFLVARGRCRLLLTALMGAALPDALDALGKDGLVLRRHLSPLPGKAVDKLLDQTLDRPLHSQARAWLHRQCGGYPLDLRELLLAGSGLGVLRRHGTEWTWSGRVGAAPRLVELVETRMRAVRPEIRSTVELVACGEPLPITAVESGVGGLPAAEEAGLVQVVTDGRRSQVRLTHPVDGEVLRETMPRARARRAFRMLVTWLAGTPMRRDDDHVRLTTWTLAAGLSGPTRKPGIVIPAAAATTGPRPGQPSAAGEAAARGRLPVEECPRPTGAERSRSDAVGRLTRREREMAMLAAQWTSREIAMQLSLSVRTVDNHLARVYAKLGVAARAELPAVLAQPPAPSPPPARTRRHHPTDPAFGLEQGGPGAALRSWSAG